MSITIGENIEPIQIGHKDLMGSLTDITKAGNYIRMQELDNNGKHRLPFNLSQFLKTTRVKDYIAHLKRDEGIENPLITIQRGSSKGSYGHLYLMIYVAQHVSDKFTTKVIKTFVNSNILNLRDDGGNDFKRLNKYIDKLEDRTKELKPKGNTGCYIQISKMIRLKIFTEEEIKETLVNIWNTSLATASHQEKRKELENEFILLIHRGYIKTYDELKKAVNKLP